MPHRWCICAAGRTVPCALAVDVLIHQREVWRPTSTGRLIQRTMAGSRLHVFRPGEAMDAAVVRRPERELWVLHPLGERLEAVQAEYAADPARPAPQVLLLDGNWREATRMMRAAERWGRPVGLPMTGESRYRLRGQQGEGQFSTVEALLFLLKALGQAEVHAALELQFELHVYAGLRARGDKAGAEKFLPTTRLEAELPEMIAELNRQRPRVPKTNQTARESRE
jgi:DTW domain-containing protein YfiP